MKLKTINNPKLFWDYLQKIHMRTFRYSMISPILTMKMQCVEKCILNYLNNKK